MYGVIVKAAVYTLVAVLLNRVLVDPFMSEAATLIRDAPGESPLILTAVETVGGNFLLLCIISILVMVLGRAVVEKRLPGV